MSDNEYVMVWTLYIAAALIALACWCWLTESIKSLTVRLLLRLPMMAIALTPVHHALDDSKFAPAIAGIAIELIAGGNLAASSYIMVLMATIVASIALALVLGFIGKLIDNASAE